MRVNSSAPNIAVDEPQFKARLSLSHFPAFENLRSLWYSQVMKARIYIDTSVLGGCEDSEFQEYCNRLMSHFAQGDYTLVISSLTIQELELQAYCKFTSDQGI
jgi:hypothetical protein